MTQRRVIHMHFGTDGGAERFFVNLCKALAEAGVEQRFVIRPNRAWAEDLRPLGEVYETNFRLLSPQSLWLRWRLRQMRAAWRPDATFAWMSRASKLLPQSGGGVRITRLGDYPRHLKNFAQNDVIVANTPGIAQACCALGWQRPLGVISNFVRDVTPCAIARTTHDTPDDAFLIVGSGRFIHRKGFDTLIRAFAQVDGAYLWLAGEGEKRPALEALARDLGVMDRVRFLGWVEEPMHLVASADAYVMPSRHEPLGNVILEAWRSATPVVATRSEGPSWFCQDGKDALLVDIDDVDAMAQALLRLQAKPDLAAQLVAAGQAQLSEKFTKSRVLAQYLALIDGDLSAMDFGR
ncbi:glycosyltransferase [Rhodobacterales bacterium LSUCC0387]|nr:glycosyltransferase [Rhodobacterales bacterium LSUCC0374]MBF9041687.1 glycosyltransferase [Rhodobacterales bacterium LSUCC0387]